MNLLKNPAVRKNGRKYLKMLLKALFWLVTLRFLTRQPALHGGQAHWAGRNVGYVVWSGKKGKALFCGSKHYPDH